MNKRRLRDTDLCGDLCISIITQTLRVFIWLLLHLINTHQITSSLHISEWKTFYWQERNISQNLKKKEKDILLCLLCPPSFPHHHPPVEALLLCCLLPEQPLSSPHSPVHSHPLWGTRGRQWCPTQWPYPLPVQETADTSVRPPLLWSDFCHLSTSNVC